MGEGKSEVKERLGWVAIFRHILARLRWPISVQANVSHIDTLSPALHCGSCLKGAGAGQGCRGSPCEKKAEKAKPHRGSYLCRSWAGGGMEGMKVGGGESGTLRPVTVPDSSVLSQQCQGQGIDTGRGRESTSLGVTWAVERKPCGIWPFSETGVGAEQGIVLHWASGFSLDPGHLPGSVDWKQLDRRKELHLLPDSSWRGSASSEKEPTCIGWVTHQTRNQRDAGHRTGAGCVIES